MAITPDEAQQLTESEKEQIKKFEDFIDAYIADNFNDANMEIELPTNTIVKKRVKDELVKMYKKAGWKYVSFGFSNDAKLSIGPYEPSSIYDR